MDEVTRKRLYDEQQRIYARLCDHPPPMEHGPLYAAQQALAWALDPSCARSPFDLVTDAPRSGGSEQSYGIPS